MEKDWQSFFVWVKSTEQKEWEEQVREYEQELKRVDSFNIF